MYWLFLFFLICVYARYIEPNLLFTPVTKRKFRDLPEELNGIRIAHISDIHGRLDEKGYPLIDRLKRISPDFVVITGDFVESENEVSRVTRGIGEIARYFEVFYVPGNNDFPRWRKKFISEMEKAGAKLLLDNNTTIQLGGARLTFIGINDPVYSHYNLERAMEGIDRYPQQRSFSVLLSHSPIVLRKVSSERINLLIAGHTHGGQVFSWLFSKLHSVFGDFWMGYTSGWLKSRDTLCFVSRGIGCSRVKVRFLSFPEMPIIVLSQD